MKKMKILTVFGTRPEVIKLAPFIKAVEADNACLSITCATTQHKELQDDVLKLFDIIPHYNLDIMREDQDLFFVSGTILARIKLVLEKEFPDFVVVQGDTTTAFISALSAFYYKIPVVHIEAGLRTGNMYGPFPEEINRNLISKIASFHMAPTLRAVENLARENVHHHVFHVGNTIVDAVETVLSSFSISSNIQKLLDNSKNIILITVHRRENFGEPLQEVCEAIHQLSQIFSDMSFIWPVHPNPNIKNYVTQSRSFLPNVHLIEPVSYSDLVLLLNNSDLILTDSGGIQEESCILGKQILILRNETEREEVIESGLGELVGTSQEKIISAAKKILSRPTEECNTFKNIYGLPGVSQKILEIMKSYHQ